MNRLADKTARDYRWGTPVLVAETAKLFADEGAKVVISARRKEKLEQVAKEIEDAGGEVLVVPCDIANVDDANHLIEEAIRHFGQIDILVNNAGTLESGMKPIESATGRYRSYYRYKLKRYNVCNSCSNQRNQR